MVMQRFLDKGYVHDCWLSETQDITFITGFNKQYKHLENIFKKYWPILQKHPTLKEILPNRPKFIYRKAPGLRTKLVKNVPDTLTDRTLPCLISKASTDVGGAYPAGTL